MDDTPPPDKPAPRPSRSIGRKKTEPLEGRLRDAFGVSQIKSPVRVSQDLFPIVTQPAPELQGVAGHGDSGEEGQRDENAPTAPREKRHRGPRRNRAEAAETKRKILLAIERKMSIARSSRWIDIVKLRHGNIVHDVIPIEYARSIESWADSDRVLYGCMDSDGSVVIADGNHRLRAMQIRNRLAPLRKKPQPFKKVEVVIAESLEAAAVIGLNAQRHKQKTNIEKVLFLITRVFPYFEITAATTQKDALTYVQNGLEGSDYTVLHVSTALAYLDDAGADLLKLGIKNNLLEHIRILAMFGSARRRNAACAHAIFRRYLDMADGKMDALMKELRNCTRTVRDDIRSANPLLTEDELTQLEPVASVGPTAMRQMKARLHNRKLLHGVVGINEKLLTDLTTAVEHKELTLAPINPAESEATLRLIDMQAIEKDALLRDVLLHVLPNHATATIIIGDPDRATTAILGAEEKRCVQVVYIIGIDVEKKPSSGVCDNGMAVSLLISKDGDFMVPQMVATWGYPRNLRTYMTPTHLRDVFGSFDTILAVGCSETLIATLTAFRPLVSHVQYVESADVDGRLAEWIAGQ